ncbi:MAG: Fur family transcriptional regulator [Bacillota bacterium]|nr:Fur family transcriptional regulator [Bacillota bacterium]MDD3298106.1 Fur family transcriptional regulator [Bacillota bacterium]MDD3851425.1 Fur family transcriptional regulator [Bacillota bacterium]MDD4707429.1 Fur family transcriptional regulator [Bacillota bacterium]
MLAEAYHLLKEQKVRMTPQRKAILEILYDFKGHHLEIEDIHRLLTARRGNANRAGIATIYRAIELFQKVGLVSRLPMENSPARYEFISPRASGHHHLICLGCGKVEEIDDWLVDGLRKRILQDKGFSMAGRPIKIYGYCSTCSKKVLQDRKISV